MTEPASPAPRWRPRPLRWSLILLFLGTLPWAGLLIWAINEDRYSTTWRSALQFGLVGLLGVVLMAVVIFPFVYFVTWLVGRLRRRSA